MIVGKRTLLTGSRCKNCLFTWLRGMCKPQWCSRNDAQREHQSRKNIQLYAGRKQRKYKLQILRKGTRFPWIVKIDDLNARYVANPSKELDHDESSVSPHTLYHSGRGMNEVSILGSFLIGSHKIILEGTEKCQTTSSRGNSLLTLFLVPEGYSRHGYHLIFACAKRSKVTCSLVNS